MVILNNTTSGGVFRFDMSIGGHVVTLLVLTCLFIGLAHYYRTSLARVDNYQDLPNLAMLIFVAIEWIRKLSYQIVGKAYNRFIPFFIYIISIFWFSNLISILGFDSLGTSIVVPLSLALIVFLGTVASGIFFRGFGYFGDYFVWLKYKKKKIFPIPDPLKFVGELSKVFSLTFRLWGNTLAGSLILFVLYTASGNLLKFGSIEWLSPVVIPLLVFPLHFYFDVIDGTIQPLIFLLLTMCYWAIAQKSDTPSSPYKEAREAEEVLQNYYA